MKDRVFYDTNILVYLYSNDDIDKREIALHFLKNTDAVISTQVLNELSNTLLKKVGLSTKEVMLIIKNISEFTTIVEVNLQCINQALLLKEKYKYSYYDSLILATALFKKCKYVYSEDMQNNQKINNRLIIENIFTKNKPE